MKHVRDGKSFSVVGIAEAFLFLNGVIASFLPLLADG
jgi:hypothetical protein